MKKYEKIENIVNYDAKGKLPVGFTEKYNLLKNLQYYGTEKVDGTNIGIVWDGYNITFQGRTEKSELPKNLEEKLKEIFLTPEMENVFEQIFGEKQAIIFGEGYGYKIQNGGERYVVGEVADFIVFDIMINDVYLMRESVEDICSKLNLKVVPIVFRGTLVDAVDYVLNNRESKVALMNNAKNNIEGIVCQPCGIRLYDKDNHRIIFKVKYRDVIKMKEVKENVE